MCQLKPTSSMYYVTTVPVALEVALCDENLFVDSFSSFGLCLVYMVIISSCATGCFVKVLPMRQNIK